MSVVAVGFYDSEAPVVFILVALWVFAFLIWLLIRLTKKGE